MTDFNQYDINSAPTVSKNLLIASKNKFGKSPIYKQ